MMANCISSGLLLLFYIKIETLPQFGLPSFYMNLITLLSREIKRIGRLEI